MLFKCDGELNTDDGKDVSAMRSATLIPASIHKFSEVPLATVAERKVAAYARVSTENEDQKTSYAAQVDYYTNYIKSRVDWEFAGMYSDEGVTGTSMEKREGVTHMVQDAPDGKIQLIVTKSVSRFARNTVDSLTTIRKLKEHGVEVYSGARRGPLDHSQQPVAGRSSLHFGERHMGTQEKILPTASSPSDTLTFSATIKVRTAISLSTRSRQRSCGSSSDFFLKE